MYTTDELLEGITEIEEKKTQVWFNVTEDLLVIMEEKRGWSRDALADACGFTRKYLDNALDEEDGMTLMGLVEISDALGCKLKITLDEDRYTRYNDL